jgi:hypothetical protein
MLPPSSCCLAIAGVDLVAQVFEEIVAGRFGDTMAYNCIEPRAGDAQWSTDIPHTGELVSNDL